MARKGLNVVYHEGDKVAVLYQTKILVETPELIILNSGGWRTRHTKNCINDLLPDGFYLFQKNYEWYVTTPLGKLDFKDNMEIDKRSIEEMFEEEVLNG